MSPRPILKHSSSSASHRNAVVHFPPSPSLTRTFSAHSSSAYDRSPIIVSPNSCAIPPRGGRIYSIDDHPLDQIPPLILDLSSESEESDGFLSSPSELTSTPSIYPFTALAPLDPAVLSFLPHPQYPPCYESDDTHPKHRKRPLRRRERSRDRSRIRTTLDGGERDDESESPVSPGFGVQDADIGCLGGF